MHSYNHHMNVLADHIPVVCFIYLCSNFIEARFDILLYSKCMSNSSFFDLCHQKSLKNAVFHIIQFYSFKGNIICEITKFFNI